MVGQLFTGFCLGFLGWRAPFICFGLTTAAAYGFVSFSLHEPERGSGEDVLSQLQIEPTPSSKQALSPPPTAKPAAVKLPKLTAQLYFHNIMIPTVAIMLLQTVPNTIPWGVLSTHLHDLLATDAHFDMRQATTLIAVFGLGAAVGGVFGGVLGQKIYVVSRGLLPVTMGVTMVASACLLRQLLVSLKVDDANPLVASLGTMSSAQEDNSYLMTVAVPMLLLSGALAAVNGANIRVLVLNVCSPTTRGSAIATLNIVNCLGRGLGPTLADLHMHYFCQQQCNRQNTVQLFLYLWILSGAVLCLAGKTFPVDEDKMKQELRRLAAGAGPEIEDEQRV
jgi:MFS family permease